MPTKKKTKSSQETGIFFRVDKERDLDLKAIAYFEDKSMTKIFEEFIEAKAEEWRQKKGKQFGEVRRVIEKSIARKRDKRILQQETETE